MIMAREFAKKRNLMQWTISAIAIGHFRLESVHKNEMFLLGLSKKINQLTGYNVCAPGEKYWKNFA